MTAGKQSLCAFREFRRRLRARRAPRPICVVSSPRGFSVVGADWTHIETFPFGRGQEAFALAARLDPRPVGE